MVSLVSFANSFSAIWYQCASYGANSRTGVKSLPIVEGADAKLEPTGDALGRLISGV